MCFYSHVPRHIPKENVGLLIQIINERACAHDKETSKHTTGDIYILLINIV